MNRFSLLAALLPFLASSVYAQVQQQCADGALLENYALTPNEEFIEFPLDFNEDDTTDFVIQHLKADWGIILQIGSDNPDNQIVMPQPYNVTAFFFNNFISPNGLAWYSPIDDALSHPTLTFDYNYARLAYVFGNQQGTGNFANRDHRYVGVRFKINGAYHYGYVDVSSTTDQPNRGYTIHCIAYNTAPNQTIRAGAEGTVSSIRQIKLDKRISVSPNPTQDVLRIGTDGLGPALAAELFDQSGRSLRRWENNDIQRMDVSDFAPGLYVLRIQLPGNFTTSRKLVIR